MEFDADPVQLPELPDRPAAAEAVQMYPVCCTYKRMEETFVPVNPLLVKYLLRKQKYRGVETGGILGLSKGVITHYYHDHSGQEIEGGYFPNYEDLNWILAQWKQVGTEFGALLHIHAPGECVPSASDLRYVSAILSFNPKLPSVLLGIVADGQLTFFRFERDFLSERTGLPSPTDCDTIKRQ